MYRHYLIALILLQSLSSAAQFKGRVIDEENKPLSGVNIYLKGSFHGTTTNAAGLFELSPVVIGDTIIFSFIGFESRKLIIREIHLERSQFVKLKAAFNLLKAVSISAGNIEVSDKQKSVVLQPLDVVTTSGALGDVIGALKTLPGTANNDSDGRLFVRGGSADETAIFIDGLRLGNAFGSTLNGIPTRSRFSPQLFKGSYFSTGAYSAEYGQALSSVLSLNTVDFPLRRQTDLGISSVGASASHTEVWDRQSLSSNFNYTNLQPYMSFVPQNIQFVKAPQGISNEFLVRQKVSKRGLFKAFYAFQYSSMEVLREQVDQEVLQKTGLDNFFHHINLNYQQDINSKNLIDGGLSFSANKDDIQLDSNAIEQNSQLLHLKVRYQYFASAKLRIKGGTEHFERFYKEALNQQARDHKGSQTAAYTEANYHFNSDLAFKIGLRQAWYANSTYTMPRASLAYRLNQKSSFSLAYGDYVQEQSPSILVKSQNLSSSKARHLVLNYQFNAGSHVLRLEAYHKTYQSLLRQKEFFFTNGSGYARGFDLFWRNRGGIKNLDYWLSYSFIDSKRHWRHFNNRVQPNFAPTHNASLVTKYWIEGLQSQLGTSFILNSGYRYDNPNLEGEMESLTKAFHSLNLSWSYLPQPNLIIHFEMTNVLGRENIFGYQYGNTTDANGKFSQRAIPQAAPRFIFLGLFYTISSDKKANQLNNL